MNFPASIGGGGGGGIGQLLMGGPGSLITDQLTQVGFNLRSCLACSIDLVLSVITKIRLKKIEAILPLRFNINFGDFCLTLIRKSCRHGLGTITLGCVIWTTF